MAVGAITAVFVVNACSIVGRRCMMDGGIPIAWCFREETIIKAYTSW